MPMRFTDNLLCHDVRNTRYDFLSMASLSHGTKHNATITHPNSISFQGCFYGYYK